MGITVGNFTVDRAIENTLLKISFGANGSICNYSFLSKRKRDTLTLELTQSKVFAAQGNDKDCAAGKLHLDNLFKTIGYEAAGARHEFIGLSVKSDETAKLCPSADGVMRLVFDKNRNRNK